MYAPKYNTMRPALRADIQMGGACYIYTRAYAEPWLRHPLKAAGAEFSKYKCIGHLRKAPRSGMRDACRRLMSEGLSNGYYGKDWR